jgi:glycerol-3-phosphate dehydrogenase (NAD(P)+)
MKVSIVGTGMFGFSIANHLGNKHIDNNEISIMTYDSNKDIIVNLKKNRKHIYHFNDKKLPHNISFTTDKKELANNADIIVIAVTSKAVREVTREIKPYLKNNVIILNTAKALERETAMIFSEVVKEELNDTSIKYNIAKMSGGTFAEDILNGSPLGADIACENLTVQKNLQDIFHNENLRVYGNTDLIGVEYAGAFKNIIAIFAGIINGLGLPYGSETHIISRAAKEAKDIAVDLGAEPHTFSMESQCWGNDLWMSCTGKSRNREFGRLIGAGLNPDKAMKKLETEHKLVEGYYTVEAIPKLCKKTNINAPIFNEIHKIVYENKNPRDSIIHLMKREAEEFNR